MREKFNLTWHTFSSHGQELFRDLMESQEFSDVTLVSDDQHQYKVHKFILSACSTVFRKILNSNPHNSSIYLRGIHHDDLESILQFIYLGEASFYHERMNEFLNVAKNLYIKEIGKNVVAEDEESEEVSINTNFVQETPLTSEESQSNGENVSGRSNHDKNISSLDIDVIKPFKCQQCNFQSAQKANLHVHIMTKHEGLRYPCQKCDYQFTRLSILKQHVKSQHEGYKYPCQQCDYMATYPVALKQHIKSKHEGIKYPCQQCDYKATNPSNLYQHMKSQHKELSS